mgnify:CR=1 FL=1
MNTLLEINGLYGGYERGVNILQGIDLSVAEGEALGIIGLNGSGKSTLGKAVMNLLPYRSGHITFDGQDITGRTSNELSRLGIAIMHQGGTVFPNLSVLENIQLAIGNTRLSDFASQYSDIIPLLKKSRRELSNTMADKLSGGQRHELALAMTLSHRPRLLILDEPSAGLSPIAVEEMYAMLNKIREQFGAAIMLIEQNIARAVEFCCTNTLHTITNGQDGEPVVLSRQKPPGRCVMLSQGNIGYDSKEDNELNISKIESLMFKN